MEAIRFECKSCGATVSARDGIAVCEYCGGKHKISYSSNDIDIELLRKVEAQDTKIDGIVGAIGVKKERDKEVKKLKKLRRKLRRAFQKRSRSMNGVAVRDGELILWGMKAMV